MFFCPVGPVGTVGSTTGRVSPFSVGVGEVISSAEDSNSNDMVVRSLGFSAT